MCASSKRCADVKARLIVLLIICTCVCALSGCSVCLDGAASSGGTDDSYDSDSTANDGSTADDGSAADDGSIAEDGSTANDGSIAYYGSTANDGSTADDGSTVNGNSLSEKGDVSDDADVSNNGQLENALEDQNGLSASINHSTAEALPQGGAVGSVEAKNDANVLPIHSENVKRLRCIHNDMSGFFASLNNARIYNFGGAIKPGVAESNGVKPDATKPGVDESDGIKSGVIKAGVVPHHLVAADLISGFFKACNVNTYDTVVIVAPNHVGGHADVVYSRSDWEAFVGIVGCDVDLADSFASIRISDVLIEEADDLIESDHSASVMIPYISHYLPDAKVAPVLVSRTLSLDNTLAFASELSRIIVESEKRVLLVCSIDFSHFLTPSEAAENDRVTEDAIRTSDYQKIHDLQNEYVDSPASLIIFLRYLEYLNVKAEIIDNTDASEFLGYGIGETTSYFVIVGA